MALKEYFKIDLETGDLQGLTPYLFDDEVDEVPSEFKLGWGGGIHLPKFNLELNNWMEGLSEIDLLNIKKLNKLDELNKTCNEVIYGKFSHVYDDGNTYFFSCDAEAQSNFDKVDRAFDKNRMTAIPWTAYDSSGNVVRLIFTKDNFEGLYVAHLTHIQSSISNLRDYLMPLVLECSTPDEVNSIGWDGKVEPEPTPEPTEPEAPIEETPPTEETPTPETPSEPTEPEAPPTDETPVEPTPTEEPVEPTPEEPVEETPIEESAPTTEETAPTDTTTPVDDTTTPTDATPTDGTTPTDETAPTGDTTTTTTTPTDDTTTPADTTAEPTPTDTTTAPVDETQPTQPTQPTETQGEETNGTI